jgi:hypothetical protein
VNGSISHFSFLISHFSFFIGAPTPAAFAAADDEFAGECNCETTEPKDHEIQENVQ